MEDETMIHDSELDEVVGMDDESMEDDEESSADEAEDEMSDEE